MKRFYFFNLTLAVLLLIFSFSIARAQEQLPPPEGDNPPRPNLLQELGLSQEQVQEVRRIMRERQPVNQGARRRLKEANEALDTALYADRDDEAEIQLRLKEVHAAQMEVIKNRVDTERAVRHILTPAQLVRFRDLQSQFKQMNRPGNNGNNRQDRRNNNQNKDMNRPAGMPLKPPGRRPGQRPIQ